MRPKFARTGAERCEDPDSEGEPVLPNGSRPSTSAPSKKSPLVVRVRPRTTTSQRTWRPVFSTSAPRAPSVVRSRAVARDVGPPPRGTPGLHEGLPWDRQGRIRAVGAWPMRGGSGELTPPALPDDPKTKKAMRKAPPAAAKETATQIAPRSLAQKVRPARAAATASTAARPRLRGARGARRARGCPGRTPWTAAHTEQHRSARQARTRALQCLFPMAAAAWMSTCGATNEVAGRGAMRGGTHERADAETRRARAQRCCAPPGIIGGYGVDVENPNLQVSPPAARLPFGQNSGCVRLFGGGWVVGRTIERAFVQREASTNPLRRSSSRPPSLTPGHESAAASCGGQARLQRQAIGLQLPEVPRDQRRPDRQP